MVGSVFKVNDGYLKETNNANLESIILDNFGVKNSPLDSHLIYSESISGKKPSKDDIAKIITQYSNQKSAIDNNIKKGIVNYKLDYDSKKIKLPKEDVIKDFKKRVVKRLSLPNSRSLNKLYSIYSKAWKSYESKLPKGLVHYDFHKDNVFLDGNKVKVIDWEKAGVGANYILDLPYLLEDPDLNLSESEKMKYVSQVIQQHNLPIEAYESYNLFSTQALLAYLSKLDYSSDKAKSIVSILKNKADTLEKSSNKYTKAYSAQLKKVIQDNFNFISNS